MASQHLDNWARECVGEHLAWLAKAVGGGIVLPDSVASIWVAVVVEFLVVAAASSPEHSLDY